MTQYLIKGMMYSGSVIMAVSLFRYVRFSRQFRSEGNWDRERAVFLAPAVLLSLLLAGYLAESLSGHPDLLTSGILFGGSVFVFAMVLLICRIAARIRENGRIQARRLAEEEAARAKTSALSGLSQDVHTSLDAIIGYTALANRECVSSGEKTEYLREIEKVGYRLMSLVNDVQELNPEKEDGTEP